jgi:hypothetical protein
VERSEAVARAICSGVGFRDRVCLQSFLAQKGRRSYNRGNSTGYFDDFSNEADMAKYAEVKAKQKDVESVKEREERFGRGIWVCSISSYATMELTGSGTGWLHVQDEGQGRRRRVARLHARALRRRRRTDVHVLKRIYFCLAWSPLISSLPLLRVLLFYDAGGGRHSMGELDWIGYRFLPAHYYPINLSQSLDIAVPDVLPQFLGRPKGTVSRSYAIGCLAKTRRAR